MFCKKCRKEIPEGSAFCLYCGVRQEQPEKKKQKRTRPNGTGTAYKRGKTWTAVFVCGWQEKDGVVVPVRRTKGGFPTKREALEYIPSLKAMGQRNPDENITFAELYERFYASHADRVKKTTAAGYKAAYGHFSDIASMRFTAVGVDDLQYCVDEVPGKRTRLLMKSLAGLMYKYAGSRQLVTANLAQYIYIGKGEQIKRPAFTAQQMETLWGAAGRVPFVEYILCMCYLGFRPNEMLTLKKSAYHEENGFHYLVGGFKTEAGTNRNITISPKLAPILSERLSAPHSDYLFPKRDGSRMSDDYFRDEIFYPVLEQLGIQPIPKKGDHAHLVPYSCRHTFANLLKNVPGSDTDKAALMGHADASMTKQYQSEELENLLKITNAL